FELVETEARDRAAQERLGLAHLGAIGLHPADEGLLHDILGVRDRAEHAVGDTLELRTQRLERSRRVVGTGLRHQAAALAIFFASAGSTKRPKPTAMRFQPLMMSIIKVSFTCSSALKCAASASRSRSRLCP